MSFSGGVSLFPLIWRNTEALVKIILFLIYHITYYFIFFEKSEGKKNRFKFIEIFINLFIIFFNPLVIDK